MEAVIKKWGNSLVFRLSASLTKEAHLTLDQKISVKVKRGKIIFEPVNRKKYKLEELVAVITTDNSHAESDFGKPVGKEVWQWSNVMCQIRMISLGWNSIRK